MNTISMEYEGNIILPIANGSSRITSLSEKLYFAIAFWGWNFEILLKTQLKVKGSIIKGFDSGLIIMSK